VADTDSDTDGIANCNDNCPNITTLTSVIAMVMALEMPVRVKVKRSARFLATTLNHLLDIDIFKFRGTKGETVKIHLEADPPEEDLGKQVTLILTDKIKGTVLVRLDRSVLPNEIKAKLPTTGEYLITVAEQPLIAKGERYRGAYCLTLGTTTDNYKTLAPAFWVE